MSELINISNNVLNVTISTFGAELKSIKKEGKEFLWGGNPKVWSGQAPLLFPICGGLKDDKYIYDGKEYTLPKHGFARHSEFILENKEAAKATFLLKSNAETKKCYPFDFETRVTYELDGEKINVEYAVTNTGDNKMYFSIGAHEGYDCPDGIENYTLIFDKEESFDSTVLNGNMLEHKTIKLKENSKELPLKYKYFEIDAQVFLNLKSRKVTLKHNTDGKCIDVEFDGADYLLIWTKPNGKYICIEPWCGIPDFMDSDYDITNKVGIIGLDSKQTEIKRHSIKF